MTEVNQAFAEIKRGAEEILVEEDLLEKLKTGKPLKVDKAPAPAKTAVALTKSLLVKHLNGPFDEGK